MHRTLNKLPEFCDKTYRNLHIKQQPTGAATNKCFPIRNELLLLLLLLDWYWFSFWFRADSHDMGDSQLVTESVNYFI